MTWNIQHGRGMDGEINLERIAALIVEKQPDLVALQEVDRGVRRTDGRNLDEELAELTDMERVFGKASEWQGGDYGNAILSREEIEWSQNEVMYLEDDIEERAAIRAQVTIGTRELIFFSTHFSVQKPDRLGQVDDLVDMVLEHDDSLVVIGLDLNDQPGSAVYEEILTHLTDPWPEVGEGSALTWPASEPTQQLDYILKSNATTSRLRAIRSWVPTTLASDHRTVITDFEFL